jgi:LacI family transcriptional regulator
MNQITGKMDMENHSETTKGRVTLADVAREAGVSTTTASLAMRNRSDLVADKTITHVQSVARELNYVYNISAASLRTQRSMMVALILPTVGGNFFGDIAVGAEDYLDENKYAVLLAITHEEEHKQAKLLQLVQQRQIDGVILCVAPTMSDEALRGWKAQNTPMTIVPRLMNAGFDSIAPDYRRGAEIAVEHLIGLGHKRIAYIGGTQGLPPYELRLQGFYVAHQKHGLEPDATCIYPILASTGSGYRAVMQLYDRLKEMPEAYFCYNDFVALGVMSALQRLGIRPGHDVSVVGFDNMRDTDTWYPPLTTIDSGPQEVGRKAAELLLERINERERPIEQIIIEPRLIIRDSCLYKKFEAQE